MKIYPFKLDDKVVCRDVLNWPELEGCYGTVLGHAIIGDPAFIIVLLEIPTEQYKAVVVPAESLVMLVTGKFQFL